MALPPMAVAPPATIVRATPLGFYQRPNTGPPARPKTATLWPTMASMVNIVSATISTIAPWCPPDATVAPKRCNLGCNLG
jgi:hypothetical protein